MEKEAYYVQKEQVVFRLSWGQGSEDQEEKKIGEHILSTFKFIP